MFPHLIDLYPCMHVVMKLDVCFHMGDYTVSLSYVDAYVDKPTVLAYYHALQCFCAQFSFMS